MNPHRKQPLQKSEGGRAELRMSDQARKSLLIQGANGYTFA